jgi:glycosyltransferase involved in cell wall biosynthesis
MRISVVCPVLNEIKFIKQWYKNVSQFADEIIVLDTGSTDGTPEWLETKWNVYVERTWHIDEPYQWQEHIVRNSLIKATMADWIVPLDADELVGKTFIESLNYLDSALIHRYLQIAWWAEGKVRKRQIWPLCERLEGELRWLRNWRGMYPCYTPRVFKRDDRIRYSKTGNHCFIQYKNLGRLSYHIPGVTKTHKKMPFFHYHYIAKQSNIRDKETPENRRMKLINYDGYLFPY